MPSADLPLASCCEFASGDFEAMHHRLGALLKPHRMRRLSNVPVSGLICRARLRRVSINLMRIGPAVDVWPGRLEKFFLVQIPVHGAVQITLGESRILSEGAMAAVISPGEPLHVRWSDNCTQMILQIPREIMEARLAGRVGERPRGGLKFQTAFDLSRPAGREWRQLLDFTVRTVDSGGPFSREPLCSELEDLLLSALLAAQPHTHAAEPGDGRNAVPYYVLRAEREMQEHLAEPLRVSALAAAAGVSERTLHDGFRRFRATTPMGRLLALRLATARRRLRDAPAHVTVAAVAAEVGCFQFGRFAGKYYEAFGELPSETLRAAHHSSDLNAPSVR